ncbi:hypothetical protein [Chelativorans sp. M5D2P16]|uniref:hypothetical protein n=1 Tax=Chelativorans sp. M5D2P16 TaxID=3095678 RepID=UPI002ACB04C7|nr:hypothetical protein [Chelativorans sp. M5D2P16]MDZ5696532.1 hypothetical protein [Chelativorans sp. M5D2P16]
MRHLPTLPDPGELALPLRDFVRGLRQKTAPSRSRLKPALELLPTPLRDRLEQIARDFSEGEVASMRVRNPGDAVIARAAAGLKGADVASAEMAAATAFATAVLLKTAGKSDLLISETVAAICWHEARHSPHRATTYMHALNERELVGTAPGLAHGAIHLGEADHRRIYLALVLWLLADRSISGVAEADLLNISRWLADDVADEVDSYRHQPDRLERLLREHAERI